MAPSHCEICGYRQEKPDGSALIERHRIIPGREGGRYVLGNVIALCPTHHAEADFDLLDRKHLQWIVNERIRIQETLNG